MPLRRGAAGITPWLGTGMALTAVLGATALMWMPAAHAEVDSFYKASARSVFIDAYFSNPTIPGGVRPEGGGPQTDVTQTSLDQGDANASFPYFGDVVPTAPGVVSGLFGVPVPPYPFTASSTFGGRPAEVSFPGFELSATSRSTSTVADVVVGSSGAGATAHSEVDESSDGNVVATSSTASPLTVLGPLVSLKGFESAVTVLADANGTLTRTSNFAIDQISVPGLVLRIPESTPSMYPVPFPFPVPGVPAPDPIPAPPLPIPMGGQTITEPQIGFKNGFFTVSLPFAGETQEYALPAEPVVEAFEAQGVTLRYTAPQETPKGVLGGVFTVQYTLPAPPENPFYNGETPATFIIGDTRAEVDRAKAAPLGAGGIGADVPAATTGTAAGEIGDAVSLPAVPGAPLPVGDLGAGTLPTAPGAAVPPTVNLTPEQGNTNAAARLVAAGLPAFLGSDFSVIYLGLVGVAVVAMASVAVLGAKGVSARWSS